MVSLSSRRTVLSDAVAILVREKERAAKHGFRDKSRSQVVRISVCPRLRYQKSAGCCVLRLYVVDVVVELVIKCWNNLTG